MPTASKLFFAAAALFFVAGCDSTDPDDGRAAPTVQFGTAEVSALEATSPSVDLPVTLGSPDGRPVEVDVLFALAASDGASLADLGVTAPEDGRAYVNADGDTTGYVLGTVSFPANAEDGATRTLSLPIADDVEEGQEVAVLALQSATAPGGGSAAQVGEPRTLTLTIAAEGTQTLLSEDFSDGLGVFTAFSVASNATWATSESGGASNVPYALANGFGADAPSNDWLISPALDFASVASETLTFISAKGFDDGGLTRGLNVKVSTDYDGAGNPEDFTWTDVTDRATLAQESDKEGNFTPFIASGAVDLSDDAFQSESVYVAFQYLSSGTGPGTTESWEIDNVVVTGQGGGGEDS